MGDAGGERTSYPTIDPNNSVLLGRNRNDYVSCTIPSTCVELRNCDLLLPDGILGDTTGGALDPTGGVSPNVSCFRWEDLAMSYNQKLWMRDLLKGATYPPS